MCTTVSLIGKSIDHHLHNMWLVLLLFSPKKSIKEIRLLQYYSSSAAAEEWNGHFVKLDRSVFIIISISLAHTQPSNGSSWLIRFLYLLSKKVKFLLFLMLIAKALMRCLLLLRKASLVNI